MQVFLCARATYCAILAKTRSKRPNYAKIGARVRRGKKEDSAAIIW